MKINIANREVKTTCLCVNCIMLDLNDYIFSPCFFSVAGCRVSTVAIFIKKQSDILIRKQVRFTKCGNCYKKHTQLPYKTFCLGK